MLTIAYITTRKNPRIRWFFESLDRETKGDYTGIRVVIVDFHADSVCEGVGSYTMIATPPKPNIWQGPHRLTKQDWFAASNARNTALCYAPDGHIAYCDDLSVLLPGWLEAVRRSINDNYIAFGAYRKVRNLVVENGQVKSFDDSPRGHDSRWGEARSDLYSCAGSWLFGCSVAMPVQALLDINGWPESLCDGLSFEDVCCGIVLGNSNKYGFRYDRTMLTFESEELHSEEPAFRREDWHFEGDTPKLGGNGHNDKSHSALNIARDSKWFPQYLGDGFNNIAELRQHILNGGAFPIRHHPDRDWFTKQLLCEI